MTTSSLRDAKQHIDSLEIRRVAKRVTLTERKVALEALLPPSLVALTQQLRHARTIRDALRERKGLLQRLDLVRQRKAPRLKWKAFTSLAAQAIATMESALTAAKTKDIEASCIAIFDTIMRSREIVPALRTSNDEELHLRLAEFYGEHDVAATALLSESFRNALAISIYLSALLDGAPLARFVVLDDITSSFDAGRQFALMEAIRTMVARPKNLNGPQVIILSHDGLLEKYFDRLGAEDGWRHQHLQGAAPRGMLFAQGQAVDRVRQRASQLLSAGQVQEGQPFVRQYLEYILQQIIRRVGIGVPIDFAIKDNNKMVSQSLDAIRDAVDIHARAGDLILSKQSFDDLMQVHTPAIVGNWVAHYETGATLAIAPTVLVGVLQSIDNFAECFKYTCTCAGPPRRRWFQSLTRKACPC